MRHCNDLFGLLELVIFVLRLALGDILLHLASELRLFTTSRDLSSLVKDLDLGFRFGVQCNFCLVNGHAMKFHRSTHEYSLNADHESLAQILGVTACQI